MIRKILIANRGEIVCRIVRTCREMGIATVAIYSDADRYALHVEQADEAISIADSTAQDSYLNIEKIIEAAKRTGADAVHPGCGFLAENAVFAQAVIDAGLNFIGPPPHAIHAMSSPQNAKRVLQSIPSPPAHFGDDHLILEHVVHNTRHIEVQIFGDKLGNMIAVGERECTLQRQHQTVIAETPSTFLTTMLRMAMFDSAVNIGTQLGYYGAGTIKFLVDDSLQFYFLNMQTSLTIGHPITEETTGFDLVRWQIMVAEGFPLPDMDVYPAGHAIEARVYAEDPSNTVLPATSKILRWRVPGDVRVDAGVHEGEIITDYDPLVAKIAAYGEHRRGAIRRLDYALSQMRLLGVKNNIAFLRSVLMHPDHLAGNFTNAFIAEHPELMADEAVVHEAAWAAVTIALAHAHGSAVRDFSHHRFKNGSGVTEIRLLEHESQVYTLTIENKSLEVELLSYQDGDMTLVVNGHRQKLAVLEGVDHCWWVSINGSSYDFTWQIPLSEANKPA